MSKISNKRHYFYLLLLVVLAGIFIGGEAGVISLRGGEKLGIFQAPKEHYQGAPGQSVSVRGLGDIEDLNMLRFIDGASKTGVPNPTIDPFEGDLRRLARDGDGLGGAAGGGSEVSASKVVPASPSPSETPNLQEPDSVNNRQALDPDDGRNIFQDIQQPLGSQVSEVIPGVVVRSGAPGAPLVTPVETPGERGWVGGQARGYTMLYAMQPEARPVVESQVDALLSARIREPHIGVLVDGTFGRDFNYLKDIVTRLSGEGRRLTLTLYLSNGPTMRDWRSTSIDQHIFQGISPEEFRATIRRDTTRRLEFLGVVLQAKDVFQHSLTVGPQNKNVAVVMLEDNLDFIAYGALREIAAEQLGSLVQFVRNPCIGCRKGNDDNTLGDRREEHSLERFDLLGGGDGYSLDGVGFNYPGGVDSSAADGDLVNPEQLVNLINLAKQRGLGYFGLWRHAWQGVRKGIPNKNPEERSFGASNQDQLAFEIEMLRTALTPEDDGSSE